MSYLYVIRAPSGRRKIGLTVNLEQRLKKLGQSSSICEFGEFVCEFSVECDAAKVNAVEAHAHALLWDRRIRGEWFWVDLDTAREAIAAAQIASDTGAPMLRRPSISNPGLWRGDGCEDASPRTAEWYAKVSAEFRERDRIMHIRRSEAGKARWARRRAQEPA
jgi:hypothetical protein